MKKKNRVKNHLLFLTDAIGWPLGQSFLAPQTILPLFVARLTPSNFLLGLVAGIHSFGQFLPQILAANLVEQLRLKKRYVVWVGLLAERLPILFLVAAIFLTADPLILLVVFFSCWSMVNVAAGFNVPAFMALFAKGVNIQRRGRVMGFGTSAGTLLAAGGAAVAREILQGGFYGYAWVFLIGFVVLTVTVIPLGFVDEVPDRPGQSERSIRRYLREIPRILRNDRPFGRYIVMRIFLSASFVCTGFITGYAVRRLGASEATVALFTVLLMAAHALGSLLFGLIGDSHGYRLVFIMGSGVAACLYLVLSFSPPLTVVYPCFILAGVLYGCLAVGSNMSLEFFPQRAAMYSALVFTIVAPFRIVVPLLAGLLADTLGFPYVFGLAALLSAVALGLCFRISDPRQPAASGKQPTDR